MDSLDLKKNLQEVAILEILRQVFAEPNISAVRQKIEEMLKERYDA